MAGGKKRRENYEGGQVDVKVDMSKMRSARGVIRGGVIVIDLPFPPSLNNLFPTIGKRRIVSKEYDAWKEAAGWEIRRQRPYCAIGAVEISITLQEQSKRMDLDNRIKALCDLLVSHGIIEADHNKIVRKITAEWNGSVLGARVEISPAPSQQQRRAVE